MHVQGAGGGNPAADSALSVKLGAGLHPTHPRIMARAKVKSQMLNYATQGRSAFQTPCIYKIIQYMPSSVLFP